MPAKNTGEPKTTYILVAQCLQNGFFLDAESRLRLPVEEAIRILVGSPDEFEPELKEVEDDGLLADLFKLTKKAERDLFIKFLNEKRLKEGIPQPVNGDTPSDSENGASVKPLREVIRDRQRLYMDFVEYRAEREKNSRNRRTVPKELLDGGPLYQFLEAVIEVDGAKRQNELHFINIRDWHQPSSQFDEERQRYGLHCEAGTWSAEPIDGLERFLAPWLDDEKPDRAEKAAQSVKGYEKDGVHYYDIRSDTVFDFYPHYDDDSEKGALNPTPTLLEEVLQKIITGNREQRVVLVMIGVYTDIKVRIMLTNLRSRYPIDNLIVSDVLTAAPSLERHLSALDFAVRVLNVEVIHSLNDLAQLLNPQRKSAHIPQTITQNSVNFREHSTYFLDKQHLLAYQEQKQLQYIELTKRRAARVYKVIFHTSRALMYLGVGFVVIAAIAALYAVFNPNETPSEYLIGTGLLGAAGLGQLLLIMYSNPIKQLQKNLNNLVRLQTSVETQSLVQALTRYHVSRPERLYPKDPQREKLELENLQKQIDIITNASQVTSQMFAEVDDALDSKTPDNDQPIPRSSITPQPTDRQRVN